MSLIANSVSIHPYFKVHAGQLDAAKALLPRFAEKTITEPKALYYEFTLSGDVIFCREAYVGAEGAQAHLANVGEILGEMLKITDLVRLEIHGPADELDKLRAPFAHLNAEWFVLV
jgi:quinol monooxygenase YgiN